MQELKTRIAAAASEEWMVNNMRLKVVDYDAMRVAFDEQFKKTYQLIQNGETYLDNLAEGFHEADGVIWRLPTIDAVPVVRCKDCVSHENCLTEDTFRIARIENPYCCGGKRKMET